LSRCFHAGDIDFKVSRPLVKEDEADHKLRRLSAQKHKREKDKEKNEKKKKYTHMELE
jgi:hypothetical protein